MDLFPFAMQCLSENLDITGTTVQIIESYLLLNAHTIIAVSRCQRISDDRSIILRQQYSERLLQSFDKALSLVILTNVKDLMRALSLLASLVPISIWAQHLLSSGLFANLIKNIIDDKVRP